MGDAESTFKRYYTETLEPGTGKKWFEVTPANASLPYGQNELEAVGLTTAPSSVVKPPRIAEVPASLECTEWGTLQIGENRLIIGLVKRVHVREELIDRETLRIRGERFHVIGRMASPHWYCRTRDRFEMIRPK
jgi:flavin reductase (DIM6/NTAB) family NADH-FMN oxidoreductase RutF